jgi:multiple sugar transport system ATP-binding protein
MASLSLQGVSKSYRHRRQFVPALSNVDLAVDDGELMVVVGPSGCGKTTMLRLIAGLERVDAGEICIDRRVVDCVPPNDRDVAMVFQNHALYPHLTVGKNLAFPLKMRKTPRAETQGKVDATAQLLGIAHLLDRKPDELSGGEQQRVALGRAVIRQPRLFLFDEPLSNLDPALRGRMRTELKALHRRLRTTTIYVTHDQEEAMTLGDRVAVLHRGRIQQIAAPLTAYEAPANRFVAGFFGQPPMNFLNGHVIRDGRSTRLMLDGGELALPDRDELQIEPGTQVTLGVRPHHMLVTQVDLGNPPGMSRLADGRLDWIENLGDSVSLHVVTGAGDRLLVKAAQADGLHRGSTVRISFDPAKTALFRAGEMGERLP